MQTGDNMSKYIIELRCSKDEKWRQYGEYDSYFSAWRKDKYEKFWFHLNRLFWFSKSRHIETRIVKLNEEK